MKTVIAFAILLIAYFCLIASQSLFPFIDLPNHLAEATLYQLSGNSLLDQYYEIEKGLEPNSFHYIFCSLFTSVELGNKIYYLFYVLLFIASVALLIHHFKGNWKFSFFAFLLLFNYNVTFGFTGFTLAIPVVLIAFYLAIVNQAWSQILLAFVLTLLFFIHILGLLFSIFLIGALALFQFNGIKGFLKRVAVVLPALLIIFIWHSRAFTPEQSTAAFLVDYFKHHYVQEFPSRVKLLVYDNFVLASGVKGIIIGALFSLMMLSPVSLYFLLTKSRIISIKTFISQYKEIAILILVSIICCLFLPNELPGQGILYQRYSVFLFTSVIIAGSVLYKDVIAPAIQAITIITVLAHFLLWTGYLVEFDQENKSFNASFFKDVPSDKLMSGFIQNSEYRGRPVYIHFQNYNLIWNHGVTATKIIDYRFGSFRRKVDVNALPEYQEWAGSGNEIPKEYNVLNYLLLKGEVNTIPSSATVIANGNDWRIIKLN